MLYALYIWYILRHKWWVLYYAHQTGASLRLALLHDLSKFGKAEFGPYARWFYGEHGVRDNGKHSPGQGSTEPCKLREQSKYAFDNAWRHHKECNKHHPEYWYQDENGYGEIVPIAMPDQYIGEMVADWLGAGRAITGRNDLQEWWDKNDRRFVFHPRTSARVRNRLRSLGVV